ncbi:MAG: rod shape-determining protein RodA [Candidatus Omnitrophica bacterium]|nr:rod shape-determining protein RodA [Candidatus Omnitrophota bacterium]
MLRNLHRDIYWPFIWSLFGLIMIGTLFIWSAGYHDSGNYVSKQMVWILIGLVTLLAVYLIGYRTFLNVSYLLYVAAVAMLFLVFVAGQRHLGAQRWLQIGPLAIQPSEFAKLATVLAIANFLGSHHSWEKSFRIVIIALGLFFLPLILIVKQPDLGTALLFVPMILAILFLWGIQYRYLIVAGLSGLVAAPFFWQFLKEYQRKRILTFMDPSQDPLGAGYTAIQAKIAVGSGGLLGKGYMAGTQSQLQFVPEHHTDFIFCVLGEEWGFIGALLLLCLYGFLFRAAFQIMNHTTDVRAKLLVGGVVTILFSQVFINIGMTFGLMPITGLTLPLVSYGGSSFMTTMFALGLVLSINRERSIF